jgi:hypothetical protein
VSCIRNIFAQSWKGVALDCVEDAEPLKVPREDLVKPGKRLGQSRFIKEVLRRAETSHAFQKNVSFFEQGFQIPPKEVRGKKVGSVLEEFGQKAGEVKKVSKHSLLS